MSADLHRLASRVFDEPLMIEPQKLRTVIQVLEPRLLRTGAGFTREQLSLPIIGDGTGASLTEIDIRPGADPDISPELRIDHRDIAIQGLGRRRRDRDELTVQDSIAIIDVIGILVHRHHGLNAFSGLTSYEMLRAELDQAVESPDVNGILLRIDSPGGEVSGVFDLADQIRAANQAKPVWAVAEDRALSGAYALASGARRLYVTQNGFTGSIGVIMAHVDQSKFDEQQGVKVTEIFAGAHKADGSPHRPLDDEAHAEFQRIVDDIYALFVAHVARNRSLEEGQVRATEARIYMGQEGRELGLADRVGSLETAFEDFRAKLTEESKRRTIAVSSRIKPEVEMAAIPRHKTDTSDGPWDGPENEARLRNDESESYYRRAYAWVDPDVDPETKAAYSFIHHEVDGDGDIGPANVKACQSTIGILNGGRGGGRDSKWWGDRDGIYEHVAGHIRDAGLEPPDLKPEEEVMSKVETNTKGEDRVVEPQADDEIMESARAEAAAAERKRIAELEAIAPIGYEGVLAVAREEGWSPGDFAVEVLRVQKAERKAKLQALKDDDADVADVAPVPETGGADREPDSEAGLAQRAVGLYARFSAKPKGREIVVN